MARRRRPEKREILPDPRFGDVVLSKFMNLVMYEGKKSVAEQIVYSALETIEAKSRREPVGVFHDALANVRPASKCARAASVVPPIRCRSRSAPNAARRSPYAG